MWNLQAKLETALSGWMVESLVVHLDRKVLLTVKEANTCNHNEFPENYTKLEENIP